MGIQPPWKELKNYFNRLKMIMIFRAIRVLIIFLIQMHLDIFRRMNSRKSKRWEQISK
eukprot:UN23251